MKVDIDLESLRPWCQRKAESMCRSSRQSEIDDLAQEGMIEMWRSACEIDMDSLPTNTRQDPVIVRLKANAYRHMVAVVTGARRYVGTPRATTDGWHIKGKYWQMELGGLAHGVDGTELDASKSSAFVEPNSDREYEAAELFSVHGREIWEAVSQLPDTQREYVKMRFMYGMTFSEIQTATGKTTGFSSTWSRSKAKLRESLAHLEGAI